MKIWTVKDVLIWATDDFKKRQLASPRLDAELLLTTALNCARIELYTGFDRPLNANELKHYRELITRRRNGEPISHILGQKEFWSLTFEVTPDVLSPRPETEILVETALSHITSGPVLDLCTGSGCIACALAKERPEWTIDAADISKDACAIAGRNIDQLGFAGRVNLHEGDLFEAIDPGIKYSGITANPPYISETEMAALPKEVKREPAIALCGGADGLDLIRRIVEAAPNHLKASGWLIMEIDHRQATAVRALVEELWGTTTIEVIPDLSGKNRIVAIQG